MGPDGPKGPRLVRLASIPAKELCSPDHPRPAPAPPRRGHNTVDLGLASPRPVLGRRRRRSPSRRSQTAFCFLPSTEPCGGLEPQGGAEASRALANPPLPPSDRPLPSAGTLCAKEVIPSLRPASAGSRRLAGVCSDRCDCVRSSSRRYALQGNGHGGSVRARTCRGEKRTPSRANF